MTDRGMSRSLMVGQKTVKFEQVAAALDNMVGADDSSSDGHARALGAAEVLLHKALFGTSEDWQSARNVLINHMDVKA